MSKSKNRSENYLRCKVEKFMAAFDIARFAHRFCVDVIHYVVFFDGKLFILHSDQLDECDGEALMSVVEVHGGYISKSQRETLRERIKNCLRSEL